MKRPIIAFVAFVALYGACAFGQTGTATASQKENFTFRKDVEEVILYATVLDKNGFIVNKLERNNFSVFEDGILQPITSLRNEDVPVTLGIVIDNSGSMRDKRRAVNVAMVNLIKASNPKDEVFWVNFNKKAIIDQDFTSDISLLNDAAEKVESRAETALFDAIVASYDYAKDGKLERKVLVIVTDGDDNASELTLESAIREIQEEKGVAIYVLALVDDDMLHKSRAKRNVKAFADATGGVAYFPKSLYELNGISAEVARDIRNQYEIGYKPINPDRADKYHKIKVVAKAPGYGTLKVRTRDGYYAGKEQKKKPKK